MSQETIVQHVALNCRDHRAQEAFYTEFFGFRRVRVSNPGKIPGEFLMLRLGGMCLELFTAPDPAPTSGARGGEQAIGFRHLAFAVPDLEAAIAKLNAAGFETEPVVASVHVPGLRRTFFKDPDGNILELMHGWTDGEEKAEG